MRSAESEMTSDWNLRKELCEIGRRVYDRGLVAGTDGNISARLHWRSNP